MDCQLQFDFEKEKEIWVPVQGFEPRFKISNHGYLISIGGKYLGERLMSPGICSGGYILATLRMSPKIWHVRIHTLVALHFIAIPPSLKNDPALCVNHKDGNKLNNYYKNLEWTNNDGNTKHAVATGLMDFKGENHPMAKLTAENVREIRRLYATGKYIHREIGEMFGISRRQTGDIINRKNWGWLD